MEPADPDLPLVKALQAGDKKALTQLIETYEVAVFRFVCRYLGNEEDARDLAQETFLRVYLHVGDFTPRARFKSWLFQIATNLCRDHARRWSSRLARKSDSIDVTLGNQVAFRQIPSKEKGPGEQAEIDEAKLLLQEEIRKLPHDLRTALVLFTLEGLSQIEVAGIMRITPKAVETRVYRAKKLLHERLRHVF